MIETLHLNVSGTKRDVALKQRPDRFPSIGDHIQVIPTFEHLGNPKTYVIEGS